MLVMKFGGAAVSAPEQFAQIAELICARLAVHKKIVVVVSAMGNATNDLISLSHRVHPNPPRRELDMLISVGERISIALLAMALDLKGHNAVSFTGSQSGILTTADHTEAKILDVKPRRLIQELEMGRIVIVAGFQGVSSEGEITTLGRGGSDTTAVALGIALGAEKVEFYKDVAGVFENDPKTNPEARLYETLNYEQALEITRRGAKILHHRCVALAFKNKLPLYVSSFKGGSSGTLIGSVPRIFPKQVVYE